MFEDYIEKIRSIKLPPRYEENDPRNYTRAIELTRALRNIMIGGRTMNDNIDETLNWLSHLSHQISQECNRLADMVDGGISSIRHLGELSLEVNSEVVRLREVLQPRPAQEKPAASLPASAEAVSADDTAALPSGEPDSSSEGSAINEDTAPKLLEEGKPHGKRQAARKNTGR